MTTTSLTSSFLQDMEARGLIHQCTDLVGIDQQLTRGQITAYVGFDATADSLHAGHLLSLMTMRRLLQQGHKVIALIGGTTSLVGDPSFRTESRPMLDSDTIARNREGILRNIAAVLRDLTGNLLIVDNAEWLADVRLIHFMR